MIAPATLVEALAHQASTQPDGIAAMAPDGPLTWTGLQDKATEAALALSGLGVGPGDVVAVQLPNSVEFVVSYLAIARLGAAMQTVHMPYMAAEMTQLLCHSRAKVFIGLSQFKNHVPVNLARSASPTLSHVLAVGPNPPSAALPWPGPQTPSLTLPPPPSADATMLLLYTSGTTSAPKGVPVAHAQFLPNAAASARALGVEKGSILLSAAPFTHLYGLFSLHMALMTGATTSFLPVFTPDALAATIARDRPSALLTAPAHMVACLDAGLMTPDLLKPLNFLMISGAYCPPELALQVQQLLGPRGAVVQLWGMSEMQAGSFTRPEDPPNTRIATVGQASPGTELRVTRDGACLAPGDEGEIEVRGPSVFSGYRDNAEATATAFSPDGWFKTGDLGEIDSEGYLRLTGRSKELINRGGIKYNPSEIEVLLARHPAIVAVAIVPMPDPVLGERACCFAVPAPDEQPELADLCAFLEGQGVTRTRWPEWLELLDELPMTPTRKVMKGELSARARKLAQAAQ